MRKKVIFPALFLIMAILVVLSVPNLAFATSTTSPLYVNGATGSNSYDGTSSIFISGSTGPKATIGAAINGLSSGGTVYVAAGTYGENVTISKSLTLQGAGSGNTVIDGGGNNSVITTSDGFSIVIKDLTITNGEDLYGGGVQNWNTSNVTIENCIISHNVAGSGFYGGGIYNTGTMTIRNCTIESNSSEVSGGGIGNNSGTMEIMDSKIINNSAVTSGGGIYNYYGTVTIHNSTIANNTAPTGAGIYDYSSDKTVYAQNNWWGTSTGPGGNINDPDTGKLANGSGNAIYGHVYFDSWLTSDPFAIAGTTAIFIEPVWIRTMQMTCKNVWINQDNKFQFSFIYPYANNNWVKIYDMGGKEVFSIDMPYDNPNIIVDLPDGTYTVKTFHDKAEPLQTFVIGKP
jgi:hypothetical protein